MVLSFLKVIEEKIPCTLPNMEAKNLPADVCVFGHFERV